MLVGSFQRGRNRGAFGASSVVAGRRDFPVHPLAFVNGNAWSVACAIAAILPPLAGQSLAKRRGQRSAIRLKPVCTVIAGDHLLLRRTIAASVAIPGAVPYRDDEAVVRARVRRMAATLLRQMCVVAAYPTVRGKAHSVFSLSLLRCCSCCQCCRCAESLCAVGTIICRAASRCVWVVAPLVWLS